jgi:hypothetical protein
MVNQLRKNATPNSCCKWRTERGVAGSAGSADDGGGGGVTVTFVLAVQTALEALMLVLRWCRTWFDDYLHGEANIKPDQNGSVMTV